jgi:protocatechuate 3,4-dioxygenase, alpha subunit
MLPLTPSQTIGPFFHVAIPRAGEEQLVEPDAPGAVRVEGRLLDGAGDPVADGLIEIWQASSDGRYDDPKFNGFGRCATDAEGHFGFITVKPGQVPQPGGLPQAPHINVSVFARGILHRLVTRIYFSDEEEANRGDPVLSSIDDLHARSTLVARRHDQVISFDVHLQGNQETVFFDI